jgi:hypothetical protein
MKNRFAIVLTFCLFIFALILNSRAQSAAITPAASVKSGSSNNVVHGTSASPAPQDAERKEVQDLTARVLKLEIEAVKSKPPEKDSGVFTAIIAGFAGLIAALVGGGMTLLGQRMTADREQQRAIAAAQQQLTLAREAAQQELELARKEAVFQQTEKILEFRIKQMENFYAPMFALLKQSTALYNKMCDQLAEDEPARYKRLSQPDAEGYGLHVLAKDGNWKGFRLLDQMPAVKKNSKAFTLVTEIIGIGEKTTKIISEHAGLASAELIGLLGEYLAHFALLSTVYKGAETEPYEPLVQKTGYFSHELSSKIEGEYRELSKFLDEFEAASKRMLADIKN